MLYILDLDGTIISSYMDKPRRHFETWTILPNRTTFFSDRTHGYAICSNQGGVAFGYITPEMVRRKCAEVAVALGFGCAGVFDGESWSIETTRSGIGPDMLEFHVCYSDERSPDPVYQQRLDRRKPNPGMIEYIIWRDAQGNRHQDRGGILFIGDRPEDEAAAQSAGVRFAWAQSFDWTHHED